MRADAPARWGMPPVLHISFTELMGRGDEQVFAHQARLGINERHHVLQLIAETECPPGLVESAPRPQAARQSLIEQPAIRQHVDGRVRRFHVYRAERMLPVFPQSFERASRRGGTPKAMQ